MIESKVWQDSIGQLVEATGKHLDRDQSGARPDSMGRVAFVLLDTCQRYIGIEAGDRRLKR